MGPQPPTIFTRKPTGWSTDDAGPSDASDVVATLQRQIDFQDLEIECYRSQLLGAGSPISAPCSQRNEVDSATPIVTSLGRISAVTAAFL